MASTGTVAQAADNRQHPGRERPDTPSVPSTAARVQIPRELLRSPEHSALAVVTWSTYETLMPRQLIGGRAPAFARRVFLAERYGVGERAIDDARRELLADVDGAGPWLRRSANPGRKQSVKHMALRLPKDTDGPYVDVPAWTLDRVHGGRRRRPDGLISPNAWRLYACGIDRTDLPEKIRQRPDLAEDTFEATYEGLGKVLGASPDTGRRRLAELEEAGLFEVTGRPGGWFLIRVIQEQEEAAQAAQRYAEQGRKTAAPRATPLVPPAAQPVQPGPLTPGNQLQSPPAANSTPQESPLDHSALEEAQVVPAVGVDVREVARPRATADAGDSKSRSASPKVPRAPRRGVPPEAVRAYRALPEDLRRQIPEHGSRRVLRALAAELEHRTVGELAARIGIRWETWRYRTADITDPTAVAITVLRRGYDCPDVRCELHIRLDTGQLCTHCDQGSPRHEPLSGPQAHEPAPPSPSVPPDDAQAFPEPLSESPDPRKQRSGSLAERLRGVRDIAERDRIIAEYEDQRSQAVTVPWGVR